MGTRADYYVKTNDKIEWLASVALDGYDMFEIMYPGKDERTKSAYKVKQACSEDDFRAALIAYLTTRDDVTSQEHGWPWPWVDSKTTDYAYVFRADKSEQRLESYSWGRCACCDRAPDFEWPNMTDKQNVTLGHRSGLIVLSANE